LEKYPLVIPKTRSTKVGGVGVSRDTFSLDVTKQSLADVRNYAKQILQEVTEQQVRLGNAPERVLIDNDPLRRLDDLLFRGEVLFGSVVQGLLLNAVEVELAKAITSTYSLSDSGQLANIKSNWQWTLVRAGIASTVSAGSDIGFLGAKDYLVLSAKLDYAGVANAAVAHQGGTGFLGFTAAKLRRSTFFKNSFSIRAFFAQQGSPNYLPGELWNNTAFAGTPCIVIGIKKRKSKPRFRRSR